MSWLKPALAARAPVARWWLVGRRSRVDGTVRYPVGTAAMKGVGGVLSAGATRAERGRFVRRAQSHRISGCIM